MATSGSTNYNETRNEIIQDAFALIGLYGVGRTVSAEDMARANRALNRMIKMWQADGLHLWAKEEGYLFVSKGTGEYTISSDSSSAKAALRSDSVVTQIGANEASGQTSITVDDTTGMAATDVIGIVLDTGAVHYSTVSSVTDGTTVVIADALPSAAAENNNVYSFSARVSRPLRISSLRRVDVVGTNANPAPLVRLSHSDFFNLPIRSRTGTPSHFYYNPDVSAGKLYLAPTPDTGKWHFEFTFERSLEDFDASSDNPDLPQEWLECIIYQLALRLAQLYDRPDRVQDIAPIAADLKNKLLSWDNEGGSIYLMPDSEY